jgi:UDP-N-acetylmuramate dehydrogenase
VLVSRRHPLALVHHGEGSTAELIALARSIRDAVHDRYGVTLAVQPRLVGVAL